MKRKLKNASIVITGASSGIGRATALQLAEAGAWLTLIARREEPLESLREEVERTGGRAVTVPLDVTDSEGLRDAARLANATYGGIDAWVNNAGVFVMGELENTPDEIFHRTMEVNFHSYVYGARAVLPFLRSRGRGVLINVGSVESRVTVPYATAYASSKFAVRALSRSLRQELRGTGIQVCTVMPPSTDTPLFDHAANFAGKKLKPMEPVVSVERVADAIISCIRRPRAEVVVGVSPKTFLVMNMFAPRLLELMMARSTEARHFTDQDQEPTEGNLFEPMEKGEGTEGGWNHTPSMWAKRSLKLAALGGASSVLVKLLASRRKEPRGLRRFLPHH